MMWKNELLTHNQVKTYGAEGKAGSERRVLVNHDKCKEGVYMEDYFLRIEKYQFVVRISDCQNVSEL